MFHLEKINGKPRYLRKAAPGELALQVATDN
jgi:hypothetical protein